MAFSTAESTWQDDASLPFDLSLPQPLLVDVVVIGAGITGLMTAYFLSEQGYQVVVVEKERGTQGATQRTTAFLTQHLDTSIAELIPMFGEATTRAILESHAQAITGLEDIVADEGIDCEFTRCTNYVYANTEKEQAELATEQAAAVRMGLTVEFHPGQSGRLPFEHSGYIALANQAKFHPLKYLSAIAGILRERGVQLYGDVTVTDVAPGDPVTVTTTAGDIAAQHVVVATHAPFDRRAFFKKAVYTSYVVEATVPVGAIPEAIYEDTANPYHYFRIDGGVEYDRMVLGGADHRADIPVNAEKNFAALESYLQDILTKIPYRISRRWQGPIVEPIDGLAFIGPLDQESIWYATGFSGTGMTYGFIAAKLIGDLIQGKDTRWHELYDARRIPTATQLAYKGYDYSGELLGGAVKNTIRYRS